MTIGCNANNNIQKNICMKIIAEEKYKKRMHIAEEMVKSNTRMVI